MTLIFIPKIGATVLAIALFGPWMLQKLINYDGLFEAIPGPRGEWGAAARAGV